MIITITNTSGVVLNALDSLTGGTGPSALLATGGARKLPLPYPFGHIGSLAISGTKVLAMKPRDFRKGGPVPFAASLEPGEEWNQMVQSGQVSFGVGAEATDRDPEEEFLT